MAHQTTEDFGFETRLAEVHNRTPLSNDVLTP